MTLEALEQQTRKIIEILQSTAKPEEKKQHLLETTKIIRELIEEEVEELQVHGR